MKTLELKDASKPLSDYAAQLEAEGIVLTSKKKPVAVLVSVKGTDKETLALGMSATFGKLIRRARAEVNRGRVVSLQRLKQELATYSAAPNRPAHRTRRKRRAGER
jgi:antitoxin (DNA-binding transcriptional repressor) of toxin-antitoxin stability system